MRYVTIRLYGPLNDFVPREFRHLPRPHVFEGGASAKDVIEGFGVPQQSQGDQGITAGASSRYRHWSSRTGHRHQSATPSTPPFEGRSASAGCHDRRAHVGR